eukprot:TRINITY_DN830_c0_g1_i1.p1 TRINITY_DN830_c0_g1~~TRINITY_DN830_c0_g1_i1.p1  ORF type:complete len:143 (+),score=24.58 TRINITY_DN830_c0_g1_i1:206-634(+)
MSIEQDVPCGLQSEARLTMAGETAGLADTADFDDAISIDNSTSAASWSRKVTPDNKEDIRRARPLPSRGDCGWLDTDLLASQKLRKCSPLRAFHARRSAGMAPSVWLDSDSEEEEEDSKICDESLHCVVLSSRVQIGAREEQ